MAGRLQYIQNGGVDTSFQFEVSDGTNVSSGNYKATLDVKPIPTVTLTLNPTSKSEAFSTENKVIATLSNTYGRDTEVNVSFSGTAINTYDYNRFGNTITIPAGTTQGNLIFYTMPDALFEGNETIIIDISSVSNGVENGTQQVLLP